MKNRLEGLPYVSRRTKMVEAKTPKQQNCEKCKFKCSEKFSEELRKKVCGCYYGLGSWLRQNDFICSRISANSIKRRKVVDSEGDKLKKMRGKACIYTFEINGISERVCQKFFCKTLAISTKRVHRALLEKDEGVFVGSDKRKGKKPKNKLSEEQLNHVKNHINEFPRTDPHYCRKDSKKQYLSPELNVSTMYELYCSDYCTRVKKKQDERVPKNDGNEKKTQRRRR